MLSLFKRMLDVMKKEYVLCCEGNLSVVDIMSSCHADTVEKVFHVGGWRPTGDIVTNGTARLTDKVTLKILIF